MSGNTLHLVFDQIQQRVGLPMISIVKDTYLKEKGFGFDRLELIGTKFTMENDFLKESFYSTTINPRKCTIIFIYR